MTEAPPVVTLFSPSLLCGVEPLPAVVMLRCISLHPRFVLCGIFCQWYAPWTGDV